MNGTLICKLLRDVRLGLLVIALLLAGFQCLWAKVTQRITEEILPAVTQHLRLDVIIRILFQGPGKIVQTLIGGESIDLSNSLDVLSIGYVHPLTQTILCVWAIGRAAGAITGEIDRGTMELLLAQPVARSRLLLSHLAVDLIVIPVLCLSIWAGNWLGVWAFGHIETGPNPAGGLLRVDPMKLAPALANVAALLFAVSGYTMWVSSAGRFRGRVLGLAVLITLLQFLVNVVGQFLDSVAWLRPFTVFYYYQPQQIILKGQWSIELGTVWHVGRSLPVSGIGILLAVGGIGYGMALWTFCRRDLPAPL